MKNIFWIVLILLVTGCNHNKDIKPQVAKTETDTTVFNQKLNITSQQVPLLPEAGEVTSGWLAFIIAQSEIENFKNYNVNDLVSNARPIAEIMENLKETLPDSLKAKPVEARLSVLLTKAKILEQLSQQRELQAKKIATTAEDLALEFNNLKIQINELFLKTLEEFEMELDKYEAPIDSLELPQDHDSRTDAL
jgi:PBP1b-binding outer membrane lipoprotein LpoB